jgi:hypothetical protein
MGSLVSSPSTDSSCISAALRVGLWYPKRSKGAIRGPDRGFLGSFHWSRCLTVLEHSLAPRGGIRVKLSLAWALDVVCRLLVNREPKVTYDLNVGVCEVCKESPGQWVDQSIDQSII